LLTGERNIVTRTTVVGSGDALQVNGSAYFSDCRITGDGDTILGRGAAFFDRCVLESRGPFMWIRNTAANHGNVFVNSRFKSLSGESDFARAPTNRGRSYPNAEAVMIDCALDGISARGFGDIGGDASAIRFWEFNSTNASDGSPVDASKRNPASRRLDPVKDAEVIANYRSPAFVLGGWTPAMAPIILSSPEHAAAADGETVSFNVSAVAVPAPTFQWSRNSQPIVGATAATLRIEKVGSADAGSYQVTVTNASGSLTTRPVTLRVSRGR